MSDLFVCMIIAFVAVVSYHIWEKWVNQWSKDARKPDLPATQKITITYYWMWWYMGGIIIFWAAGITLAILIGSEGVILMSLGVFILFIDLPAITIVGMFYYLRTGRLL